MTEKKESSKSEIIVNTGIRTYHLVNGPEGESRMLPPGGSIETLDAKEAKHLLRYHDLKSIDDAAPQTASRIKAHEAEIERLKAENVQLREHHKKVTGKELSVEELNEQSAGTGFPGPGGPVAPTTQSPNPESEATHQPIPNHPSSEEDDGDEDEGTSSRKKSTHRKGR